MIELAATIPELAVSLSQLDAKPYLLGVNNGTLDLRSGRLQDSRRDDYITMVAPVEHDPKAKCPQFMAFLKTVTSNDRSLIGYLQRVVGYILTGDISEQCLFFFYGSGANGKSTFFNVVKGLLGPALCKDTPSETITVRLHQSGATPDLARLVGARAVLTSEVEDGAMLAEALVKRMTGGDSIAARDLYKSPFEFLPQFKLCIAGNHKPIIRNDDYGMWRRIQLVPFTTTIPMSQRDKNLGERLQRELPGILNWALKGCRAWRKNGLAAPARIVDAVEEYKKEMDILGHWLEECGDVAVGMSVRAWQAYDSYSEWAKENGYKPWTATVFGRKLKERFGHRRDADGVVYDGFDVKPQIPWARSPASI